MAILEAMAAAVPVVSTRVEGVTELIRDGVDGVLVEPGNPVALADGIDRFLDDDWIGIEFDSPLLSGSKRNSQPESWPRACTRYTGNACASRTSRAIRARGRLAVSERSRCPRDRLDYRSYGRTPLRRLGERGPCR